MANIKFVTAKGHLGSTPYYVGLVQHDRTLSKKETYAYLAEKTGYKVTAIKAVFLALKKYLIENANRGNISYVDDVASVRVTCTGGFQSSNGPWVKGQNTLIVNAVTLGAFKEVFSDETPTNKTEGATPTINTILDETTGVYGTVTGTDVFSIAGADLAPDMTKDDEYVELVDGDGVSTRCTLVSSDLVNVKAKCETALPAGTYTLKIHTRSGLGDEYGVAIASRKIEIA